ncbi:MAG: FeoB-associated Cys-rich membrane protein [Christensenellales bacterium]|jgi:hypothetical protein
MNWIQENLASILVGIGLILLLSLSVAASFRSRKRGGGCGLGCATCPGCCRAQEQGVGVNTKL